MAAGNLKEECFYAACRSTSDNVQFCVQMPTGLR